MSFGVTELLIIAAIVLLLFGTTKLKNLGNDLGSAIKGFKSAMSEEEADPVKPAQLKADEPNPPPNAPSTKESVSETADAKKQES